MTRHFLWNERAELLTKPLAAVLMDLRREDGDNDLLMDSVTLAELTEEADRMLAVDGVMAQYNQLERVAGQMEAVMRRAAGSVKPVAKQISDPFTQYGALQIVVLFELSDGQTISAYFHNPDTTPKKIAANDELVSWKWLLNKKDVTILVAPEQGKELNAREVARRVMKAAEKNSAAFVRNNAKRAERLQAIEAMKAEIVELEAECKDLERQIDEARFRQEYDQPEVIEQAATALFNGFTAQSDLPDRLYTFAERRDVERDGPAFADEAAGNWYNQNAKATIGELSLSVQGINQAHEAFKQQAIEYVMAKLREMISGDEAINPPVVEQSDYRPELIKALNAAGYEAKIAEYSRVAGMKGHVVLSKTRKGELEWKTFANLAQANKAKDDLQQAGFDAGVVGRHPFYVLVFGLKPAVEPEPVSVPEGYKPYEYYKDGSPVVAFMRFAVGDRVQQKSGLRWSGTLEAPFGTPDQDRIIQQVLVKWDNGTTTTEWARDLESPEPTVEPETGGDPQPEAIPDNPYWRVMTLTERARVLASIGMAANTGRPNVRAKALAALSWADLPADIRANLSQHPAISTEPEPESPDETDIDPDAIARVDAAYRFEHASDEFKAWVAESVDSPRGPFSTARAMEERAKAHGATIEWGFFGGAALDAVYVEDDDEGDVALDASDHWKKQPRDKKSGRWVLRRMKRMKQAAQKAGESVANAARKAGDYVAQALKGAGKAGGKAGHGAGDALEGGAKIDPGLAAINEIVGGAKTVAGAFDSAATLDGIDQDGYVGKIHKDGEIVGRVDMGDDGKAMVFVGGEGDMRVQHNGSDAYYSDDDAPDMVDWLFARNTSAIPSWSVNPGTSVGIDDGLRPDGAENIVKTAKGTQIATGFTVVEADTLIVSHDNQGNPNPDYPAELQPRDRGRETSIAWIRKTANQLDPDSLGKTRRADTGAPIIGPDRVVESGNGRTMAIQEAYRTGKADEYRDWLIEEAESFGLNPDRIRAMKRPMLVRVRTSDIDRRTFAIEANQDDKLAMTATEKARSDADRLDEALLSKLADDGDLLSAANRDFIHGFMASLGDAEAAQYITADGQPTAALIARVQAAVFAKAYSDDRLLELTADASKPEIANILNALNAAALEFIRAQAAAKGATDALTSEIADSVEVSLNAQAVQAIIDATNLVRKARAEGQSVDEVVNQRGLFDDIPPATAAMALFIHKNNRSAKRMATAFRAMARYVRQEAERGQTVDLFGDLKPATLEDIIGAANRELDREYGEGQFAIEALDLFATPATTGPDPAADPESEPGPTGGDGSDLRAELEAALQALIDSETNIDRYDAELDRIAGLAEAAGLMEALDAKLNEAADKLTVLLNEEAARVA